MDAPDLGTFYGNFRAGVVHAEGEDGNDTDGSAFGGKLGFSSSTWNDLSTGANVHASQKIASDSDGFGGGPFFTSADDHTIADVEDQKAVALNPEYDAFADLALGIFAVDFDKGEVEIDFYAAYEFNDGLDFELFYTDMNDDGSIVRFVANYSF